MKNETHLSDDAGPRLTRVEYWLMSTALEYCVILPEIVEPGVGELFNKVSHGVTSKLLVEALAGLFSRRWIYAMGPDSDEFYPEAKEIEAMLQYPVILGCDELSMEDRFKAREEMTRYRLTPEGGRQWELFAHPRWDMYITRSGSSDGGGPEQLEGELICSRKGFVEYFLEEVGTIGHQIVEGTVKWDVLTPWQATYWKELPEGHRVRYMFIGEDDWNWTGVPSHVMDYISNRLWCAWQ